MVCCAWPDGSAWQFDRKGLYGHDLTPEQKRGRLGGCQRRREHGYGYRAWILAQESTADVQIWIELPSSQGDVLFRLESFPGCATRLRIPGCLSATV